MGQSSDRSRPLPQSPLSASYPNPFAEFAAGWGGGPGLALLTAGADELVERVRAQLTPGPDGYADLERVAGRLLMSGRTLKRKLQARGTTFRVLLDDARFRHAQRLLEDPDLDIQHVAIALGYRDPACFTRAFRRWSGRTPSQARAERRVHAKGAPVC